MFRSNPSLLKVTCWQWSFAIIVLFDSYTTFDDIYYYRDNIHYRDMLLYYHDSGKIWLSPSPSMSINALLDNWGINRYSYFSSQNIR